MSEALRWYLVMLTIGGLGLLPAAALFGQLRSGGVLYARPLSLLLLSLVAWWLGWSAVLPYGMAVLLVALGGLALGSAALGWSRPDLLRGVRERWRLLLTGELVSAMVFGTVALARAQAPDAQHTEKPMDLMLLMAVHRADFLPPPDPWLSGELVSYYHLGHLGVDAVGRLSAVAPEYGFNLGVAMIAAMAGAAVFGLVGDLLALSGVRRRRSWLAAGAAGVVALLWTAPVAGLFDLARLDWGSGGRLTVLSDWWWWWSATRVLDGPITEFPAFSLLLGDLHAHLMALPISLLALALAVMTFWGRTPLTWRSWLRHPLQLILSAAIFAALFMTNPWDVITFGLMWYAAGVVAFRRVGWNWLLALFASARHLALPVGAALALAWPFLDSLESPPVGLGLVTSEETGPIDWISIWLLPLLPVVVAAALLPVAGRLRHSATAVALPALAVLLWAVATLSSGGMSALSDRGSGWVVLVGLSVAIGVGAAAAARAESERDLARAAWLGLATAAGAIMLGTELVNIETALSGRLNAVFKLWYHLWTLIAVSAALAMALLVDRLNWPGWGALLATRRARAATSVLALSGLFYLAGMLYAPAMALSRGQEGQRVGLDSLAYLGRTDPGLAGAVAFARRELDPTRAVLLEAVSAPYGSGGYLSAASAVPTLLNWPAHEGQWRGPEAPLTERIDAVNEIYRLGASPGADVYARQWGVDYIYVGRLERRQFGADVALRFAPWPVVWAGDGSVIYEVPR